MKPYRIYLPEQQQPIYEITEKNANFFRLARLIIDVCNDVMRDLLQSLIVGGEQELTKRILLRKNVLRNRRLNYEQTCKLFPSNNTSVDYNSLDFTLMYMICRNVLDAEIESRSGTTTWGRIPDPSDTSLLAAIERMRYCRNKFIAHAESTYFNDEEFNEQWNTIEEAVIIIDTHLDRQVVSVSYKHEMKNLKRSSTDPQSRRILMEKIYWERRYFALHQMEGNYFFFSLCTLFYHFLSFVSTLFCL